MAAPGDTPKRPPRPFPSGLWHALGYAFDRTFKTGRRRSEFEHKYRTHGDYFGYRSDPEEQLKYARTLAAIKQWRAGSASALELGCSVGVFTAQLAREFARVAAVDIAQEALLLAEQQVGGAGDVAYVRADLLELDLGRTFDVIVCAEVLMYVREADAAKLIATLERHLGAGGLIVEVSEHDRPAGGAKFFQGWDAILGAHFAIAHRQAFSDLARPYELVSYIRR